MKRDRSTVLAFITVLAVTIGVVCLPAAAMADDLFVSSLGNNSVLEYNGTTGAFVRAFAPAASGGLDGPNALVFGPNGNLFVGNGFATSSVLEYNGTTGAFITAFVPAGSGGLFVPAGLLFETGGNLLVASAGTDNVLEYNGTMGTFVGAFVPAGSGGLNNPLGLVFGPNGNLFVASGRSDAVLEYNGTTGAFVTAFVPAGSGGLNQPTFLTFGPSAGIVSEPSSLLLLACGVGGLAGWRRWKPATRVAASNSVVRGPRTESGRPASAER